jgi:uncharacterized membrane protein YgaE (UPF0421/DUF939 family)
MTSHHNRPEHSPAPPAGPTSAETSRETPRETSRRSMGRFARVLRPTTQRNAVRRRRSPGENAAWLRRFVVTTLAATVAWAFGSLFNGADALVAAILVLVTLRVSLHASMNEAIGQMAGVAIGIAVAFGASEAFGASVLSVALVVAVALLTSRFLGLGEEGAVNIAITSLIVLGPGAATDTAVDRLLGTIIGVGVAVGASYFMQSSTPLTRTTTKVAELHGDSSQLLLEMSTGLRFGYTLDTATDWLATARQVVAAIPELRSQSYEAIRYASWSPLARSEEAEAAYLRHIEAEHTAVQIRTISRTLFDIAEKGIVLPAELRTELADALHSASQLVSVQRDAVTVDPTVTRPHDDAETVRVTLGRLARLLVQVDDPSVLTLSAAIVANVERIVDTLDGSSSALTEVPTVNVEPDTSEKLRSAVRRRSRNHESAPNNGAQPDGDERHITDAAGTNDTPSGQGKTRRRSHQRLRASSSPESRRSSPNAKERNAAKDPKRKGVETRRPPSVK